MDKNNKNNRSIKKFQDIINKNKEKNVDNNSNQDDTEQLKTAHEELKQKLLMALADKENLKKTMSKDVENAREFSITKFAEQIVGCLDSLEKTLENLALTDKNSAEKNNDQASLITKIAEGIAMTEQQIQTVLSNNGIKKISPLNEKFDLNYHQAIKTVPGKPEEKGLVKEVLQSGYVIKQRVLRPAVVIVYE